MSNSAITGTRGTSQDPRALRDEPSFPTSSAAATSPSTSPIPSAVAVAAVPAPYTGRALADRAAKTLLLIEELLDRGHLDAANPNVINFTGYLDELIDAAAEEVAEAAKAAFRKELNIRDAR